jgi:hypothetical protein
MEGIGSLAANGHRFIPLTQGHFSDAPGIDLLRRLKSQGQVLLLNSPVGFDAAGQNRSARFLQNASRVKPQTACFSTSVDLMALYGFLEMLHDRVRKALLEPSSVLARRQPALPD